MCSGRVADGKGDLCECNADYFFVNDAYSIK